MEIWSSCVEPIYYQLSLKLFFFLHVIFFSFYSCDENQLSVNLYNVNCNKARVLKYIETKWNKPVRQCSHHHEKSSDISLDFWSSSSAFQTARKYPDGFNSVQS